MSLVVVGSIGLDTIETPYSSVTEALGGSAVYASFAARNFTEAYLVGVVGTDFPATHARTLQESGIHMEGFQIIPGKTFRWKGSYEDWNHAKSINTELNVFADFSPVLPDCCKCCKSLLLGNIHPDLQLQVLDQIDCYEFLACDTMNYWISGCPDQLTEVIKRVDIVFMNEDEVKQFTRQNNVYKASETILDMGPRLVVVKRGEYGSVAIAKDFYCFAPAYPIREVVDPTGAGDSFAGGFMGYLANQHTLSQNIVMEAVRYGTVLAAQNVGAFSINNLLEIDRNTIEKMVLDMKSWT
ncbi:MAG: PfkB family carbohydrate kinase [Candidatus Cloacimonadaceae bacterium]|nr:PfkB family carbohydrate kinase [Candidatus Cloacimonadaceae bacterium]